MIENKLYPFATHSGDEQTQNHLILLELITQTITGEEYGSLSSFIPLFIKFCGSKA
jgi:hypothetical protein